VVYFILTAIGWYLWMFGGRQHTRLRIARMGTAEGVAVMLAIAGLTAVLWKTLHYAGGSSSFWDALTTAISLGAQWLLNRKRLENWIFWLVVDVIYVPLYLSKELYLTSILYTVFLAMATVGLLRWHATWRRQQLEAPGSPVLAGSAA
jgi:nicotinamide mononucleotide transporter